MAITKHFVWFSGTGTTAESMKQFFSNTVPNDCETLYIDGVGTEEEYEKSYKMTSKLKTWVGRAMNFFTNTAVRYDQITGYKEKNQLVSTEAFFKVIEKIKTDENDVRLVIGGHSRGAAAGMVGFLASMCAISRYTKPNEKLPIHKVKEIILIPVDPVSGSQKGREDTNDLLGLNEDQGIVDILKEIEINLFSGKPVFKVAIYQARFDVRNEFRFDQRWLNFIQNTVDNPKGYFANKAKLYVGGFRHSSMVDLGDEITFIYGDSTPTGLLKELIKNAIEENQISCENSCYSSLKERELELIVLLKSQQYTKRWGGISQRFLSENTEVKKLYNRTRIQSYTLGKAAYSGESLKKIVDKNEPNNSFYLNNNRYLFNL